MRYVFISLLMFVLSVAGFSSEHGMYLLIVSNVQKNIDQASESIISQLQNAGYAGCIH